MKFRTLAELRKATADSDVVVPDVEPRSRKRKETPTEHAEQVAVFVWASDNLGRYPQLSLLFAIPNGGHRHKATAGKLRAEGVKAGVPDLLLPVARGDCHGLFVEMKRADRSNHPTQAQREWIDALKAQDYSVVVCYGAEEAIAAIDSYLSGKS